MQHDVYAFYKSIFQNWKLDHIFFALHTRENIYEKEQKQVTLAIEWNTCPRR